MNPVRIHEIFGSAVLVFVLVMLAKEAGLLRSRALAYFLPAGLLGLGLFVFLDPILFHGGGFGAEGVQHQVQGVLIMAVGVVELLRARGRLRGRIFGAVLPLGLMGVGLLFVLHSQHGGGAMAPQLAQHRVLGTTILLSGLVKGADNLKLAKGNWAAVGWLLLMLVAAAALLFYAEGGGASERAHGGH